MPKQLYVYSKAIHLAIYTSLAHFRAAEILCYCRITIVKITSTLCNFKKFFIDGLLRLPDCTQYQTRFCDEVIFQIKWSKPVKFEIKNLRPTLIIINPEVHNF